MNTIKPQLLKGFRDFLPDDMNIRNQVFSVFKRGFEKYGYEQLETPTLEYANILLGKYGEEAEKLIYQFEDRGGRKVAMKYDLTVPTCRVIAQYADTIPLPFKRYQIQPVWRADNTQKGRFREFYQCDADTIGTSSMIADAEFIEMGLGIIQNLGFTNAVARINNRKFVDGITKFVKASDTQFYDICISIDKLEKIGVEGVKNEMEKKGLPQDIISKILEMISLNGQPIKKLLSFFEKKMSGIEVAQQGLKELKQIFELLKSSGVNESLYTFDLSIIRGLSYYTGPVWEFSVKDGGVGSVAGCGRYDKLIGMYLGRDIPATGGSFGIERIIEIVKDKNLLNSQKNTQILITIFTPELLSESLRIANKLRSQNINTELYADENTKLEKQLKYANKKGIPNVIIIGPEEIKKNIIKVKNMQTGKQIEISISEFINNFK